MKSLSSLQNGRVFVLSIIAGLIAGGVLVGINIVLVRPNITAVSEMRLDFLLAEGNFDEDQYNAQIQSIYNVQIIDSVVLGLGGGAMLGGIYASGKVINASPLKAAFLISGIAWFVLYVVPAIKYPPSPEAAFNPQVGSRYQMLLAGYTTVSGLSALGVTIGLQRIKRKEKIFGAVALYLVTVAVTFLVFPSYQEVVATDDLQYSQQVVNSWRSAIAVSMVAFWSILGIIGGLLWRQYKI